MNVKDYRKQVEAQTGPRGSLESLDAVETVEALPQQRWSDAIRQLTDPTLSPDIRKAAMHLLQAGTFLGAQFAPLRAEYIAALRTTATDADPELRRSALDILVNLKDEFARKKLLDGLQGQGEELVPAAAALGLLARDDHGSASTVARDLLATSADGPIRAQAARVLGSDPGATDLLSGIMKDKAEFREVRRASAVALRGLNPKMFEQGALEILNDGDDFKDIKSTVGGALGRDGISFIETPSKIQ
jgi:HEAT repeat protein